MNAAAEIVEILGSENCNLVNALIKTRILANQLGQAQLAEWVGRELNGYPDDVEVPAYRVISLTLKANASNGYWRYNGQQLPLSGLSPEHRAQLTTSTIRKGVVAIESWVGKDVVNEYSPETARLFRNVLDRTFHIERIWGEAGVGTYEQILVEIRSRLLEYVLEVQSTLPHDGRPASTEGAELKHKRDSMFQGAIFGHNTTIQIGNENSASITNNVNVGDVESLIQHLRRGGLQDPDLESLREAIQEDGSVPTETKKLGGSVATWMGKAVSKAATGAWDIGVAAAGTLVAGALSSYYGFPVG